MNVPLSPEEIAALRRLHHGDTCGHFVGAVWVRRPRADGAIKHGACTCGLARTLTMLTEAARALDHPPDRDAGHEDQEHRGDHDAEREHAEAEHDPHRAD